MITSCLQASSVIMSPLVGVGKIGFGLGSGQPDRVSVWLKINPNETELLTRPDLTRITFNSNPVRSTIRGFIRVGLGSDLKQVELSSGHSGLIGSVRVS